MTDSVDYRQLIEYCTRMVYRRYGNYPFVEELTALVPEAVLEAVGRWEDRGMKLGTYCVMVTLSRCRQFVDKHFINQRNGQVRPNYTIDIAPEFVPGQSYVPNYDDKLTVESLLTLMEPRERRLLEMLYFEEMNMTEAAAVFGVTRQAIMYWHRHALSKIRKRVTKMELRAAV